MSLATDRATERRVAERRVTEPSAAEPRVTEPRAAADAATGGAADRAIAANPVLQRAIARVDEFFDGVFAPLDAWLPDLTAQLARDIAGGRLTGPQLAERVRAAADTILDTTTRPLYGAGYCASELVVSEGNPLAWWQGADRSLVASSTFGPGQAAIDLVRLEWYRVPAETGRRHVAGPFVDYLCSNEITITSAVPVMLGDAFAGVICADVLVASLEEALLPQVAELADATLINAGGRVVLSTDPEYDTGDRFTGVDLTEGAAADARVVRSRTYPFAIVSA